MQSDCSSKNRSETVKLKKASRTKITRNRNPESKSQTPVVAEAKGAPNCKYEKVLRAKYPAVFEGIGKLHGHEKKLHIDESIPPVSQTYRRTPFHLRKQLDMWLDTYQADDIIKPVTNEQTDWVSGLVVAPKPRSPKEVRVCGDYRQVNQAIKRERHPIPTLDELLEEMSGSKVFSKVHLRAGHHQIPLAAESRPIATFVTQRGVFRFKRLPFGVNSASKVFQHAIQNALRGLPGTRNIAA